MIKKIEAFNMYTSIKLRVSLPHKYLLTSKFESSIERRAIKQPRFTEHPFVSCNGDSAAAGSYMMK